MQIADLQYPLLFLIRWYSHLVALYKDLHWWAALPPEAWPDALRSWQPMQAIALRECFVCVRRERLNDIAHVLWRVRTRQLTAPKSGSVVLVSRRRSSV